MATLSSSSSRAEFLSESMQNRGRSREVSPAALAREAPARRTGVVQHSTSTSTSQPHAPPSEPPNMLQAPTPTYSVSYTFMRSPSPSPSRLSCDIAEDEEESVTPSSVSLENEIHSAYALENFHLAKILLLRLKGIEVTSDDDPRIAAVQDEDFDICFMPSGKLELDEAYCKSLEEDRKKDRERQAIRARRDRLNACERIWEEERKRRLREKRRAQKRKEQEEARAAMLAEEEARRVASQKAAAAAADARANQRLKARSAHRLRDVVSYGSLPRTRKSSPERKPVEAVDRFQYQTMMPFSQPESALRPTKGSARPVAEGSSAHCSSSSLPTSTAGCNIVLFKDVIASMHGPLFPMEASEDPAKGSSHLSLSPKRTQLQTELFSSLFNVVEWEDGERRKVKGKSVTGRPAPRRSWSLRSSTSSEECAACSAELSSAASAVTSCSSAVVSRSSSWLSFGSRSSVSTAATSLPNSPNSSWSKASLLSTSSSVLSTSPVREKANPRSTLRHSCTPRLVQVSLDDCPLQFSSDRGANSHSHDVLEDGISQGADSSDSLVSSKLIVRQMRRSVSSFVEIAKGLQSACIYPFTARPSSPPSPTTSTTKPKLSPSGFRASRADVSAFAPSQSEEDEYHHAPVIFIPLRSMNEITCEPPRTKLVEPIPLVFPPSLPVSRSPYRPQTPPPPGSIMWRMRPIANPVVLRLKALHNVLWERGYGWEGIARDGGLGCGKERVVGIAFEGLGRSRLSSGDGGVCFG